MLQKYLQKILFPSYDSFVNVNALMIHIHVDMFNIMFYLHQLPPLEARNLVDI